MSTIDVASGYWQVEMSKADKPKIAFASKYGLWEWNVMPFWALQCPCHFPEIDEACLGWFAVAYHSPIYMGDIIILSRGYIFER